MLHEPPLFAVADGMGGHSAGDIASAMAIEVLVSELRKSDSIGDAVHSANRAIYQRASKDPDLSGMGTTITALYAGDSSAQIAHVGDSRAYLLRDGHLSRLTQDHTVVGRLVQQGRILPEDADRHPQRSYLERALGVDAEVDVDVHVLDMTQGDRILLCSDGLFGMIDDDLILQVLTTEKEPQRAAERLCEEAVHAGGNDNVTTVVVDFAQPATEILPARAAGAVASPGSRKATTGPLEGSAASPAGPQGPSRSTPASSPGSRSPLPGTAAAASRAPSSFAVPGLRTEAGARRKKSRGPAKALIWLSMLVVALALGALAARMSIKGSWYVGSSGGKVTVFNGVPGTIGGVALSKQTRRTEVATASLPELYRGRLKEGIRAASRKEAAGIVNDLARLASPSPSPGTAPTPPSPGPGSAAPVS